MEIEQALLTLGYVRRLGKVIDARPPPLSRKAEDEVKVERKRIYSTRNLNLSLLQMLCPQSGMLEQILFLVGWLWNWWFLGDEAACPTPLLGLSYSVVRLPPLFRGTSVLA